MILLISLTQDPSPSYLNYQPLVRLQPFGLETGLMNQLLYEERFLRKIKDLAVGMHKVPLFSAHGVHLVLLVYKPKGNHAILPLFLMFQT